MQCLEGTVKLYCGKYEEVGIIIVAFVGRRRKLRED
jgi:hypothetical protein